jgi:hypothetical protein
MKELSQSTIGIVSSRQFWLNVTSGTTATFKVTYGANPSTTTTYAAAYAVTGAYLTVSAGGGQSTDMDATAPLTASFRPAGNTAGSTNKIDIPTNGGFVAIAYGATGGTGKTWSGATEDLDVNVGAGTSQFCTATSTTGASALISCTGGTNGEDGSMSWAIFCPNNATFGDLKAVGGKALVSIVDPMQPCAPITLAVGDLVIVNIFEGTSATSAGVSDSLGHTGTALTSGGLTKAYYYVATSAGDATISVDTTASTNDVMMTVAVYAGPFAASPLDANPAMTSDSAEAYTCNATGTLAQADELIIGYFGSATGETFYDTPAASSKIDVQGAVAGVAGSACITSLVVAATTTVTLAISGGVGTRTTDCGVATFKKSTGAAFNVKPTMFLVF